MKTSDVPAKMLVGILNRSGPPRISVPTLLSEKNQNIILCTTLKYYGAATTILLMKQLNVLSTNILAGTVVQAVLLIYRQVLHVYLELYAVLLTALCFRLPHKTWAPGLVQAVCHRIAQVCPLGPNKSIIPD